MKKFRNLPALFTLVAGFVACVLMIINEYSLNTFLWILVSVMLGFYAAGLLIRFILDKIYRKEEEKQQEIERKQEEEKKLDSEEQEPEQEETQQA